MGPRCMLVPVEDAVAFSLTGDQGTTFAKVDLGFDGNALTRFLPLALVILDGETVEDVGERGG